MVKKRSASVNKNLNSNKRTVDAWKSLEALGLIAKGENPQSERLGKKAPADALSLSDLRAASICHMEIIPELSKHIAFDVAGPLSKLEKMFPESAMAHRYKVLTH